MHKCTSKLITALSAATLSFSLWAGEIQKATLKVADKKILRQIDRRLLIGTNIAVWDYPTRYNDATTKTLLGDWSPGLVRIPGGSWSDAYYWNGNGVIGEKIVKVNDEVTKTERWVDESRRVDSKWQVDYSDYKPGFAVKADGRADVFHGNLDVETLHNYLEDTAKAKAVVTVNAGTGTAEMAAEWVKWADQHQHPVSYWEVGNELEGAWEPGHFLPDGSRMTGEIYARRYHDFATAMKAANPNIKVGGATSGSAKGGFSREMLQHAGDLVDFVSFHHYPTGESLVSDDELFSKIDELGGIVDKFRSWIQQYQPKRAEEIELGITEWHVKLPEDRQTADMTSGLWTAAFIGEMMKTGVDFANQWDLFTIKEEGGHGALHFNGSQVQAKAQYWAFWLWGQHMADTLVESNFGTTGSKYLSSYVTKSGEDLHILVMNRHRENKLELQLDTRFQNAHGEIHTLSNRSYFWNPLSLEPEWSKAPCREDFKYSKGDSITLPAFSVSVIKLSPNMEKTIAKSQTQEAFPGVQFVAPKITQLGRDLEVWALSRDWGMGFPIPQSSQLKLSVAKGKARLSSSALGLDDAVAKFIVHPESEGPLEIHATVDDVPVDPPLKLWVKPIQERQEVLWSFETDLASDGINSNFGAFANGDILPNVHVLENAMKGRIPQASKDDLFSVQKFPNELHKEDLRGITAKVMLSRDFQWKGKSEIRIVLQSEGKHWIPLKNIALDELPKGEFVNIEARVPEDLLSVMGMLYNIKITITSKQPLHGSVYLEDVGVILER